MTTSLDWPEGEEPSGEFPCAEGLHVHIELTEEVLRILGRIASKLASRKSLAIRRRAREDAGMREPAAIADASAAVPEAPPPPARPSPVSVAPLLASYEHDLARRGHAAKQQRKAKASVEAFIEAMEVRTLDQLTPAAVREYLAARRRESKWSAKTHDNHLSFLRDFGAFLREDGHWRENPLQAIRGAKRRGEVYGGDRTGTRAYTIEEIRAIIAAAEACEAERPWVAAGKRSACYRLFALTGLRHLEMKKLPWSAVYLDEGVPRIVCDGSWTKNRKTETIPLPPEAVEILLEQRSHTAKGRLVWKQVPSLNTLNLDMKRANVKKLDARGRPAGFHSFRKGLNSMARHAGVDADTRQRMMRHADPKLTLGTYSDVLGPELAAAARLLPRIAHKVARLSTSRRAGGAENLTEGGETVEDDPAELVSPALQPAGPGARLDEFSDELKRASGPLGCTPHRQSVRGESSGEGGIRTPRTAADCPPVLTTGGAARWAAGLHAAIDAFFAAWMDGGQEAADVGRDQEHGAGR